MNSFPTPEPLSAVTFEQRLLQASIENAVIAKEVKELCRTIKGKVESLNEAQRKFGAVLAEAHEDLTRRLHASGRTIPTINVSQLNRTLSLPRHGSGVTESRTRRKKAKKAKKQASSTVRKD